MSGSTTNLNLIWYGLDSSDKSVDFQTYRLNQSGSTATSNLQKIDAYAGSISASMTTLSGRSGWVLLSTSTIGSAGGSIVFSNIDQNCTNLKIVGNLKSNYDPAPESLPDAILIYVNADSLAGTTASSCDMMNIIYNTGLTVTGTSSVPVDYSFYKNSNYLSYNSLAQAVSSSLFTPIEITIPNYTNTHSYKHFMITGGLDSNNDIYDARGVYKSTCAITKLAFSAQNSACFIQYSTLSLYGLQKEFV